MEESVRDYKTQLQEYSQKHFKSLPVYRIKGESGPDHSKMFQVSVRIRDKWEANGYGASKKNRGTKRGKGAFQPNSKRIILEVRVALKMRGDNTVNRKE